MLQVFRRNQNINIFRESTKAVMEHGNATYHDKRNSQFVEAS